MVSCATNYYLTIDRVYRNYPIDPSYWITMADNTDTTKLRPIHENPDSLSILVATCDHCDAMLPFAHALRLAVASKGGIEIIDVRSEGEGQELGVRKLLQQWGILSDDSTKADVSKAGIRVKKIVKPGDPKKEIAERLEKRYHDLLVIATQDRSGIGHLFSGDLVEYLVNKQRQTTLYIPKRSKPFVNIDTGELTLRKALVPISADPSPEASLALLQRLRQFLPAKTIEVVGFHMGHMFPYIAASALDGFSFREMCVDPHAAPLPVAIAMAAYDEKADIIVMATNGRDTMSQKIMGSITEQVLRKAPCPVLAVAVE